ncbi:MAG: hypothetical protein Q9167_005971 [Letrouitia subvulpina]
MSHRPRSGFSDTGASKNVAKRDTSASAAEGSGRPLKPLQRPMLPTQQSDATHNLSVIQPPSAQRTMKMPIPRLRRENEGQAGHQSSGLGDGKQRVSHACEPCRQRKTKCSGERPVCKHCEDFNITCGYADGKRDRTRKEYNSMASKVATYERLLKDISIRSNEADRVAIRNALEYEQLPESEDTTPLTFEKRLPDGPTSDIGSGGEHRATGRAGSTDSLDHINEDFNRSETSRATGYIGKNSEISWIQKLRQEARERSESDDSEASETEEASTSRRNVSFSAGVESPRLNRGKLSRGPDAISKSTYHCDDLPLLDVAQVNAYELPPKTTADCLFEAYLESAHPVLPILGRITFVSQYHRFFENIRRDPGPKWLAILNLVFAIGARYSHLILAEWRGSENDHLIYFTRARLLGFNSHKVLEHAELQRVQIAGLMAFYLLATHQINRAFSMNGIAIRLAVALGLNLRNEDPLLSRSSKEIRYRVWWALCFVERTLAVMTGRAAAFGESDCSAPLPLPVEEEEFTNEKWFEENSAVTMLRSLSTDDSAMAHELGSTSASTTSNVAADNTSQVLSLYQRPEMQVIPPSKALYFLYHSKLGMLAYNTLSRLYRPRVLNVSWASVQSEISKLQTKLAEWRFLMPPVFDFDLEQNDPQFLRERVCLGLSYYSTMIIINRPCLCRIDRKIPNQSGEARDFNRSSAATCVDAATSMVGLLPDDPRTVSMYSAGPWWSLVHHLMQAITILMLEMSFRAEHWPEKADIILDTAQKALSWLESMSERDNAAYRAWHLCSSMLQKVAPRIGRTVGERPLRRVIFRDEDSAMQDFPSAPRSIDIAASSAYPPPFSDYINYEYVQPEVSSWQPLLFTAYDNLSSSTNIPPSQPHQMVSTFLSPDMDAEARTPFSHEQDEER